MLLVDIAPEHIAEYYPICKSYGYYSCRRDVLPSTYLEYARADALELDEPRFRINAVGNAKRAFHLQVEILCDAFGWKAQGGRKGANFGQLLDYLGKCGVLSPNILRKLNSTRNKVEHEYLIPSMDQVEDYVDIVELFLMATKSLLDHFPDSVDYELMEDDQCDSALGLPKNLTANIKMTEGGIVLMSEGERRSIEASSPGYFSWLHALVRHYLI